MKTSKSGGAPKRAGKSRKSRTGLPYTDLADAIESVKKAYNKFGTNLKTFDSMADVMGFQRAYARRVFGELSDEYGLIDKVGLNWRVSDLADRAIKGERSAVEQMLMNSRILGDLFNTFKDFTPEPDVLEQHIKRKNPTLNANKVATRFLKIMKYLNNLKAEIKPISQLEVKPEWFKIMRLKYALSPSKDETIDLAREVAERLKNDEDIAMRVLASKIEQNLKDTGALKLLVTSIVDILSKKYPEFFSIPEKKHTTRKIGEQAPQSD